MKDKSKVLIWFWRHHMFMPLENCALILVRRFDAAGVSRLWHWHRLGIAQNNARLFFFLYPIRPNKVLGQPQIANCLSGSTSLKYTIYKLSMIVLAVKKKFSLACTLYECYWLDVSLIKWLHINSIWQRGLLTVIMCFKTISLTHRKVLFLCRFLR